MAQLASLIYKHNEIECLTHNIIGQGVLKGGGG